METAFDVCPTWLGLSLLSSAVLLSWERAMYGAVSRVKGSRRRVKGSQFSPGSLCRSPVPAGCSCSSSFPSAGCSAARWCLRPHGHVHGHKDSLLQSVLPAGAFPISTEVGLTCGLTVLGIAQVAQGTFVITQVIEGDACSVHGLEVVPLVAQHLQTVLLHSLVVD